MKGLSLLSLLYCAIYTTAISSSILHDCAANFQESNQFEPIMGKHPPATSPKCRGRHSKTHHVHTRPFPQPRPFSSLLYHQSIIQLLNNYGLVSPDAEIAIVFGLIGAIISFVGVAIACLTLRFMMSALPHLHYQLESTFYSSAYVDRVLKQMSEVSECMAIVRFFDMSTCISSHYLRVKD
ncbi:hypothetical protein BGZ57DRAFT_26195 [Hyaloscypha finlandica]|nr:hypothetical protein BGZ57DRAFT_26195 [Hyaloscypha finlandica]